MASIRIDRLKSMDKLLEWSIYLTLFAVPFSKSIVEICISLGIVLLILRKMETRDYRLPDTPANLPLLFVFLTAFISLSNSEYMTLSIRALFSKNLKFIALYFLVVEAINDRIKMMNLLKMGLISSIFVFMDALIQYFVTHMDIFHFYPAFKYTYIYKGDTGSVGSIEKIIGYPTGPFPFPNDFSAWILIALPTILFIAILDLKRKILRYPLLLFSLTGCYVFVLAKTRGAWLAFILALCPLILFIKKKIVILVILLIMLILIVSCFLNSPGVIFGFSTLHDRGDMWAGGLKIFKEHPIIGNGINTFFNKFKEARADQWKGLKGSYAHNCYLQMAADTGILGLAAFMWFVISVIGNAVIFIRKDAKGFYYACAVGLTVGISGFLIHSFVDTNLYSLNLAVLFWLSMGFLVSVMKIAKTKDLS